MLSWSHGGVALAAFGLGVAVVGGVSHRAEPPTHVMVAGPYRIVLHEAEHKFGKREHPGYWGLGEAGGTLKVVCGLDITLNREDVYVPASVWAGLAELNSWHAKELPGGCRIWMEGSDAGEAWTAQIDVRDGDVVRRVVRSGEFSDIDYEKTTYRRIQDGEVN